MLKYVRQLLRLYKLLQTSLQYIASICLFGLFIQNMVEGTTFSGWAPRDPVVPDHFGTTAELPVSWFQKKSLRVAFLQWSYACRTPPSEMVDCPWTQHFSRATVRHCGDTHGSSQSKSYRRLKRSAADIIITILMRTSHHRKVRCPMGYPRYCVCNRVFASFRVGSMLCSGASDDTDVSRSVLM